MKVCFGVPELNEFFREVLTPGKIIEWGLPQGENGRIFPITFLRGDIPPSVWVYPKMGFNIYPPAWASQGVNLERIFFLQSDEPVKQLRPLFLEDTFKFIIIDSPKVFSKGDLSFVAKKLRDNKQILFLIRNYFLSSKLGNPFASLRINCVQREHNLYQVQCVKGGKMSGLIKLPGPNTIDETRPLISLPW